MLRENEVKLFRTLALLLTSLLAASMLAGCGGDDSDTEEQILPANLVSVTPRSGSTIAVNRSIVLTFDNTPADIAVSAYTLTVDGKTATIVGPFSPGALVLTVTWADGIQILNYTATGPDCCSLRVVGGTIKDGDVNVDPDAINSDGWIEITFTEDVAGSIVLQTETGEDVGWLGKVDGSIGTLERVKGREVRSETTYIIVANVSDALGNEYTFNITFVTKAKA